jgi:hypothetical protein
MGINIWANKEGRQRMNSQPETGNVLETRWEWSMNRLQQVSHTSDRIHSVAQKYLVHPGNGISENAYCHKPQNMLKH